VQVKFHNSGKNALYERSDKMTIRAELPGRQIESVSRDQQLVQCETTV